LPLLRTSSAARSSFRQLRLMVRWTAMTLARYHGLLVGWVVGDVERSYSSGVSDPARLGVLSDGTFNACFFDCQVAGNCSASGSASTVRDAVRGHVHGGRLGLRRHVELLRAGELPLLALARQLRRRELRINRPELQRAGRRLRRRRVEPERTAELALTLQPRAVAVTSVPAPASAPPSERSAGLGVYRWVGYGAAAALFATGLGVGALAIDKKNEVERDPLRRERDEVDQLNLAADLTCGAGVLTGLVTLLLDVGVFGIGPVHAD
jgi:hypothetical protein